MKKIDIGCGPNCMEGAVGLDIAAFDGVDIVHDMNVAPWPIEDNSFDYIRGIHIIEHISDLRTFIKEVHRIAKPGAIVEFITPHYTSFTSWGDPDHKWHFALASIPILFRDNIKAGTYEVISSECRFSGSVFEWPGILIYKLSKKKYEKHFAWMFPAPELYCKVKILK